MRIRIRGYEFFPSQLMMFFALVFFTLFTLLGNWQLNRADEKRVIEQQYLAQLNQPYQYVVLEPEVNASLKYRKIFLKGRYLEDRILLVDNQLNQGVAGYHVIVPFLIEDGRNTVLVNRGWVAGGYDRNSLPVIRSAIIPDKVEGILTIPSTEGFRLGQVELTSEWPQRIPYVDLQRIQQGLDFEILPYVVWLAPEMEDYYVRDWKPVWSPPEKSEAYAVQWFSFALIVLILFAALNIRRIDSEEKNE